MTVTFRVEHALVRANVDAKPSIAGTVDMGQRDDGARRLWRVCLGVWLTAFRFGVNRMRSRHDDDTMVVALDTGVEVIPPPQTLSLIVTA